MPLSFIATRTHFWLAFNICSTVTSRSFSAVLKPSQYSSVCIYAIIPSQMKDFTLVLFEFHLIVLSLVYPGHSESSPTIHNISTQLGVIYKFAAHTFNLIIQSFMISLSWVDSDNRTLGWIDRLSHQIHFHEHSILHCVF